MSYRELEVDYSLLNDHQFEELCFDLLLRLGFSNIKWRLGSGDDGRDIEASFYPNNPFVKYEEKWFFECKHYTNGVPPEKLNSKIAWADAKQPDHYVFFVSSHITNNGLTWLEDMKRIKNYKIHYIQGDVLKKMVANHNELLIKYFSTNEMKLLRELKTNWLIYNFTPSAEQIVNLTNSKNFGTMKVEDKVFLIINHRLNREGIEEWHGNNYYFSVDNLVESILKEVSTGSTPIIEEHQLVVEKKTYIEYKYVVDEPFSIEIIGTTVFDDTEGIYLYGIDHKNNGLEMIMLKKSDFNIFVRKFPNEGKEKIEDIEKYLLY